MLKNYETVFKYEELESSSMFELARSLCVYFNAVNKIVRN